MDGPLVMVHFGAEGPPGKGVLRVPRNPDGFPVYHLDQKPAAIRAVVGANRSFDLSSHKNLLFFILSLFLLSDKFGSIVSRTGD